MELTNPYKVPASEIESMKEIPQLIVDRYGRLPQVLGFELDVRNLN